MSGQGIKQLATIDVAHALLSLEGKEQTPKAVSKAVNRLSVSESRIIHDTPCYADALIAHSTRIKL